jgi:hypothetical protein
MQRSGVRGAKEGPVNFCRALVILCIYMVNWSSLGPAYVFGIDRCLVYTG